MMLKGGNVVVVNFIVIKIKSNYLIIIING